MSGIFDDQSISFDCPECGHSETKTIGWLTKTPSMICDGCGVKINLDTDSLRDIQKTIADSLSGLDININL